MHTIKEEDSARLSMFVFCILSGKQVGFRKKYSRLTSGVNTCYTLFIKFNAIKQATD